MVLFARIFNVLNIYLILYINFIMPFKPDILSKYTDKKYNIFVETGSYNGDGIQIALSLGFSKIYSIELSELYYNKCCNRFKDNKNVHLYKGDSVDLLPTVINDLKESAIIFLDAHYCGVTSNTALGNVWIPIQEELNGIKNNLSNNHLIIIDDMLAMDNTHFDINTKKWAGGIGIDKVIDLLFDINPNFDIYADANSDQIYAIPNLSNNEKIVDITIKTEKVLNSLYNLRYNNKVKQLVELITIAKNNNISFEPINIDKNTKLDELESAKTKLSQLLESSIKTTT